MEDYMGTELQQGEIPTVVTVIGRPPVRQLNLADRAAIDARSRPSGFGESCRYRPVRGYPCAALPDPQQPESTECVRKRGKEYAERLAQWLKERPNEDSDALKP
jgi:hypothetical protein